MAVAEIRNQDLAIGRRQVMRGEDGLAQARPRHNRQDDRELTALGPYRDLILAAAGALVHVAPQSPPP